MSAKVCGGEPFKNAVGIGASKDGFIVGGFLLCNWNGASVWMHVASEERTWLTKGLLRHVFDYVFNVLGAQKLCGIVESSNQMAVMFNRKIGGALEATIPNASPSGDLLIFTMTKEDCKWV